MIVFCDTSALMKLYVQELHSDWTRREVEACNLCLVSEITWPEMCAALGLKQRTQQIDEAATTAAMKRLRTEWAIYTRLAVDSTLVHHAGELALHFGLRAYDSVQLATACKAREVAGDGLRFCCFDKQLINASRVLGLDVLAP